MRKVLPWIGAFFGFLIGSLATYFILIEALHLRGNGVARLGALGAIAGAAVGYGLVDRLLGPSPS